jgi:hypothetical protein
MKKYFIIGGIVVGVVALGFIIPPPDGFFGAPDDTTIEKLADKFDRATEIKAKYSLKDGTLERKIVKNAELDAYKHEPKDEISVTIGNKPDPELLGADVKNFEPSITLSRWNEVSFKVIPDISAVALKDRTLTFSKDKILFDTPKVSYEMYDVVPNAENPEGAYKYIWYLKEKPLTNKVEFSIHSKGLDFFRQPALTEEYQNGYSQEFQKEIVVTETQVKDLDGNVLVERPENVVGSYAVYHQTKGGMNDINGKEYKTGKAFHIYRPHIIDAEGKETWGILNIDVASGIYSEEIPQEFLDKAVYPIKSNANFGYEDTAMTVSGYAYNNCEVLITYTASTGDTIILFKILAYSGDANVTQSAAAYTISGGGATSRLGSATNVTIPASKGWGSSGAVSIAMSNGVTYGCGGFNAQSAQVNYYDASAGNGDRDTSSTALPATWIHNSFQDRKYAIYATYTPGGGGAAAADINQTLIIQNDF